MTAVTTNVRNADFQTLMDILNAEQARKIDLVVPAEQLRFAEGQLVVAGQEMILEDDGFTDPNGTYLPTRVFDDQLAERLDIPPVYLRRLREGKTNPKGKLVTQPRVDLYDANANGLLRGRNGKAALLSHAEVERLDLNSIDLPDDLPGGIHWDEGPGQFYRMLREAIPADQRSFLVRLFRGDRSEGGVARALLSNRFARMDNLDGLMAMLQGIQDAGVDPSTLEIYGDLGETRMYVHVRAPEVLAMAPELLGGYRSPFDTGVEGTKRQTRGYTLEQRIEMGRKYREDPRNLGGGHNIFREGDEPLLHAGFLLTNSEVGNGRWQIVPELTVLRCTNGLTMTKDAFARTHVGSKLDDGVIEWSADTQSKELALVTAQTRDIVKLALSQEYVEAKIAELENKSGKVIEQPSKVIEVVSKRLAFTKEQQENLLAHFLMGGQATTGGLMQAVTSLSQTVPDADAAHDLNNKAVAAMELAYSLS